MTFATTSQLLLNGPRNAVMRFTCLCDGSGDTTTTLVDATASGPLGWLYAGVLTYPGVHLKLTGIDYDVKGMLTRLQFHASANEDIELLGGFGIKKYRDIGGIQNPGTTALTGSTGSIDVTTVATSTGAIQWSVTYLPYDAGATITAL